MDLLMSTILLSIIGWDPKGWEQRFRALAPQHDIRTWPETVGDPAQVDYACVWQPPRGSLAEFSNLKAIFSLGAGVDTILSDPDLPLAPIVRIVDPELTQRMTEYVLLHVLMHHRRQRLYDMQQRVRIWLDHEQPAAGDVCVGVMGLGVLGSSVVMMLNRLGFKVAGWSRTEKALPGVETFHSMIGLQPFLRRSEILVCLLPATSDTKGILDLSLFRRMRRNNQIGNYLINASRGSLQVDADIITAIDEGLLAGATLDVFSTEPLPVLSPLWTHPKVTITPHNAAASTPKAIAANIMRQIDRFELGMPLEHVIDRKLGY
jgi:glyoxylate/hydroxypyruvate reductase A